MAEGKTVNLRSISGKPASRRLTNWIDSWDEYTSVLPSPSLWRKWAGISLIAGALERKVWIKTAIGHLYPNLYVVLVGPPGVGKTILTSQVWSMWNNLSDVGDPNGFHLASSSLTSASIVDDLREATRRIIHPNMEISSFNSLAICSNELGVLLPEYDTSFMSKLTDIYDGHPYSERRRTKELNFKIDAPQLNMIACTTPSYLNGMLPEGAWDQGFLSRTLIVFSAETLRRPIFGETVLHQDLRKDLEHDLQLIFHTFGKITFDEEAVKGIENWAAAGGPPVPEHPKLMHYNTRRTAHLLKLCMIACVSAGEALTVTLDNFHTALDWLLEMENVLPDIFKAMVVGGDSRAMEECWYQVGLWHQKDSRPIAEARIVAFLAERIPAHNISRVMEVMERVGMLKKEFTGAPGEWYIPASRKRS